MAASTRRRPAGPAAATALPTPGAGAPSRPANARQRPGKTTRVAGHRAAGLVAYPNRRTARCAPARATGTQPAPPARPCVALAHRRPSRNQAEAPSSVAARRTNERYPSAARNAVLCRAPSRCLRATTRHRNKRKNPTIETQRRARRPDHLDTTCTSGPAQLVDNRPTDPATHCAARSIASRSSPGARREPAPPQEFTA